MTPLVRLSALGTILVNSAAWCLIQVGAGYLAPRVGYRWLMPDGWLYRTRAWERGGQIYDRLLKVRRWKSAFPSWGRLFGDFSLGAVASTRADYLRRWAQESCRAELTHWAAMAPAVLFCAWNPPLAWALNLLYAMVVNLPCILIQRFNRPRLLRVLQRRLACPRAAMPPEPSTGHTS